MDDDELEKLDRRNELKNKAFTWGLVAFFVVTLYLLAKMVASAI